MRKQHLVIILIVALVILFSYSAIVWLSDSPVNTGPVQYTYKIINVFPHDPNAFTQGLIFEDGFLYESTGLYGYSSIRRVEMESGSILQLLSLPDEFFGEGITIFEDKIIQLTWKNNRGFVYNKHSFELLHEFEYPTEGWGLTHDESRLIMSDGSATLYFLDPINFTKVGQIEVYDEEPVTQLNELEYIQGKIYANVWNDDTIAVINPQTGKVTGWINLEGIYDSTNQYTGNVLNGIAYDANENRLFVTGKNWSQLFEISILPLE
jgi:glutamine cyclotransferase